MIRRSIFTEIVYQRGKAKAELMPIIDHCSRLAVGHALGDSADTELALKAWRKAASTLQRYGQKPENGAKENVHMEFFNGRFKSENRLLFWEQDDSESLEKVVNDKIRYYNRIRRRSSLGNNSPMKYLKEKSKIPG